MRSRTAGATRCAHTSATREVAESFLKNIYIFQEFFDQKISFKGKRCAEKSFSFFSFLKMKKRRVFSSGQTRESRETPNETRKCSSIIRFHTVWVSVRPAIELRATQPDTLSSDRVCRLALFHMWIGSWIEWLCSFGCLPLAVQRLWKGAKIERPALRRVISAYNLTQFLFSSFSPRSMRLINFGVSSIAVQHTATHCGSGRLRRSHGLHQINLKQSLLCSANRIVERCENHVNAVSETAKKPDHHTDHAKWSWIGKQIGQKIHQCWALAKSRFLWGKFFNKN